MSSIEYDGTAILVQDKSVALISLAYSLGAIQGGEMMSRNFMKQINEFMKQINELMKENTSNAGRAALNNKSTILNQKTKITVDAARSYMTDHPNEKQLTPNALMNQIYSDVEKQCRLNNISAPSRSSIWTYLSKANLL
jgi:hypothetical protein